MIDDFQLEEFNLEIDRLIDRILAPDGFPTGVDAFDHLWALLERDQPGRDAKTCLIRRRLVFFYRDTLKAP